MLNLNFDLLNEVLNEIVEKHTEIVISRDRVKFVIPDKKVGDVTSEEVTIEKYPVIKLNQRIQFELNPERITRFLVEEIGLHYMQVPIFNEICYIVF